jgi:glucose/arabinose dehydrogenase
VDRIARWSPLALVVAAMLAAVPARAALLPSGFSDERVVDGLNQPVGFTFLPDGRLLVIERATSRVRMVVNGAIASTDPVGLVPDVQSDEWERGLLGIAVDPGWPARPYVYVFYSRTDATSRLSRFRASGDLSDPASGQLALDPGSRYDVLAGIHDLAGNHNGGTLRFGLDGMLYVSLGEDANPCAAQDTIGMKGVLLRLNVAGLPDGAGGPPPRAQIAAPGNPFENHPVPEARLVWALGLRNPFRFHVDPVDGSLFVTDVGSTHAEEVDHVTAPGQNFGWPLYEGFEPETQCQMPITATFEPPIYGYDRSGFVETASAAVIGAGIYRGGSCAGCRFPVDYLGDYFFADFYEGFLRRLHRSGNAWSLANPVSGQPTTNDWARGLFYISDFQFGPDGTLWYCRLLDGVTPDNTGEIRRILFASPVAAPDLAASSGVAFEPVRPRPAAGRVVIAFQLPRPARVSIDVYDAAGRRVERLLDGPRDAGRHEVAWEGGANGRGAPAGLYLARLEAEGRVLVQRIVVLP